MSRRRRTIAETIELYSIPNFNGCTEWAGAQSSFGYGIITYWDGQRRPCGTVPISACQYATVRAY
jgi:hypothetical protein